jgi:hypothetical protein
VDGFLVIPGVEVTTAEGHLLCLGVILPYMKGAPALEVCQATHELGGLAIPRIRTIFFARAFVRVSSMRCLSMARGFQRRNDAEALQPVRIRLRSTPPAADDRWQ